MNSKIRNPIRHLRFFLLFSLSLLTLSGCSSIPTFGLSSLFGGDDRVGVAPPPPSERKLASIPDAVPKKEPLSRYGNPEVYTVFNKQYYPMKHVKRGFTEKGLASWYGPNFHGKMTSTQEPYDMYKMTAAHKTLPLPSYVEVKNLDNGKKVVVRVNDRGPFHEGRIIDLSYTAAWKLDVIQHGTAPVQIRVLSAADQPLIMAKNRKNRASHKSYENHGKKKYLQAGIFSSKHNAHTLKRKLGALMDFPVSIRKKPNSSRELFQVLVGPIHSTNALKDAKLQLARAGVTKSFRKER